MIHHTFLCSGGENTNDKKFLSSFFRFPAKNLWKELLHPLGKAAVPELCCGLLGKKGERKLCLSAIGTPQLVDFLVHAPRGSAILHNIYYTREL